MKTVQELRQALLELSQRFEELSCNPAFEELNADMRLKCDVTLGDSWQGIESAIALLDQQYQPCTSVNAKN